MEESNLGQNSAVNIQTQNNVSQPPPAEVKASSPKSKILIISLLGFIVLALIGGGSYLIKNSNLKSQNSNLQLKSQNLTPTQSSILSPAPSIDPTANWKTYTNTKYGYSINYPDNLILGGSGPGQTTEFIAQHFWVQLNGPVKCEETTKHCAYFAIVVKEVDAKDSSMSAKEIWLKYLNYGDLRSNMSNIVAEEEVELSGVKASKISHTILFSIPMKTIVLARNNRIYAIDLREFLYPDGKPISPKNVAITEWIYASLYDQILSTFKFTD